MNGWSPASGTKHASSCINNGTFYGSIRVRKPGVYAIYTHLQFCKQSNITRFVQRLMRKSNDSRTDTTLAEDTTYANTCADGSHGDSESSPTYSSVLFATVRLTSSDEIWVEAAPCLSVCESYWGIFQLAA